MYVHLCPLPSVIIMALLRDGDWHEYTVDVALSLLRCVGRFAGSDDYGDPRAGPSLPRLCIIVFNLDLLY